MMHELKKEKKENKSTHLRRRPQTPSYQEGEEDLSLRGVSLAYIDNASGTYAATTVTNMAHEKDTPTPATDAVPKKIASFLETFRVVHELWRVLADSRLKYRPRYGLVLLGTSRREIEELSAVTSVTVDERL
ncbi:hypothetical protein K503DRAFT_845359 [Rhizopogon vinicolor AM-OR11-026]|uniref:Uncharacterized protein n=1 Tax=Rhizopogon vinicolor AM-OR11-026 TaxID=1314800 RepID=A0A1B7N5X5_9AGAM|nr:hypothetical protein K503DRAFT_845359 [Rhizopogon vinicolor AM-OR11-026]